MDPTNEEEPEAANIGGPPDASKPKKEPKDMNKKELIGYCNMLAKKVARKQLAIHDLKKKKGVANTDCEECKNITQRCEDKLQLWRDTHEEQEQESRGEFKVLQVEITKLTEDNRKLGNDITEHTHDKKIAALKLEAMSDLLKKVEATNAFYQGQLFPDRRAALHAGSVSIAGGIAGGGI